MKALTVWQPWATLIVIGAKPYEFRNWPAPAALVGHRIVIHAGAHVPKLEEVAELISDTRSARNGSDLIAAIALPHLRSVEHELRKAMVANRELPIIRCGVGTAVLGPPSRCIDLYPGREDIDEDKWAWPMLQPEVFRVPVPMKGAQGFWDWPKVTA